MAEVLTKHFQDVNKGLEEVKQQVKSNTATLEALKDGLSKMSNSVSQLEAKQHNSASAINEKLRKVPNGNGDLPDIATPETLSQLVVSGAEMMPGKKKVSRWSADDSLALILFYESGYQSEADASGDESTIEERQTKSARHRRLRVAR
ncbi:hypothetical protein HYH03_003121 [Edaphochlamys debaryana]|uniref:Uncharacterized protein n=1 Tax=Edaphochlamys debaryana TaxID=47281 RepID=A0A835YAB1_9CHLO|nr:hypothetical protein HYH03_003121 [Edaphochlamys debaryana]|eukprot:KAG2498931.1 hypothetical protein HYH03_003121 [Edaphochlamys debaryana]